MPKKAPPPLSAEAVAFTGAPPPPDSGPELGVLEEGFFESADTDNDGYVSKAEFVNYHYRRNRSPPNDADWRAFYAADTNSDGKVSREEFEEYVAVRWKNAKKVAPIIKMPTPEEQESIPVPEPAAEMGALSEGFFEEADANNDGFVSKAEFVAYHYTRTNKSPGVEEWKAFYDADANHDGQISRAEFDDHIAAQWSSSANDAGNENNAQEFPAGARVVVDGLVSATEHNGTPGEVAGFDIEKQRYAVRMDNGAALSIKAERLSWATSSRPASSGASAA